VPVSTQRIPIGLVGPSNRASSIAQQSGRRINLYQESNDGDAKAEVALHSGPGITTWGDLSAYGNIRGQHRMGDRLFIMVGTNLYEVTSSSFGTPTLRGVFASSSGRVGISDNNGKLIVGDGLYWLIDPAGSTTPAAILDDGMEQLVGTFSGFIDGYTVYFMADPSFPGRYRYSALNDPATVNGLDYLTAIGDPDSIVWGGVLNRQIVIIGNRATQFAYDSGNADNAFQPVSGAYQHVGCLCRWTAQVYASNVLFIGANDDGAGIVWAIAEQGATAERVSTYAVEAAIREALKTHDVETFTAFTYDEDGHRFYVLNLPTGTWAFEKGVGWHERARLNPETGLLERARQDYAIYWQGAHRCGAYDSGKVYTQSKDLYADDADPFLRRVETAHVHANGKWLFFNRLFIDLQAGIGLDGSGTGTDPQVMLQYSDDGGRSYSNEELTTSMGAIGATTTRVQFDRLGRSRDRVFRIGVSDPVPVVMLSAWAEVAVGR
jgi:hypothetical protein